VSDKLWSLKIIYIFFFNLTGSKLKKFDYHFIIYINTMDLLICDDCRKYRELINNNFHKEAEEVNGECGNCEDDYYYREFIIIIENFWLKYNKKTK